MKFSKILKEFFVVWFSWAFLHFIFYEISNSNNGFYSLFILCFIIFYRVKKNKNDEFLKKYRKKFWIISSVLFSIAFLISVMSGSGENNKTDETAKVEQKEKRERTVLEKSNWKENIEKISKMNVSKSEKFYQVMMLTEGITLSDKELLKYSSYLLNEYDNSKYIESLSEEDYALRNIFISYIVSENTDNRYVNAFSFDIHQISKYIYRGVDTPTSHDTLENVRQLEKMRPFVEESIN